MKLERVMSMMRYWPANGTAGLARSRVRGKSRSPAPPASSTPSVSLIILYLKFNLQFRLRQYRAGPWLPRGAPEAYRGFSLKANHKCVSHADVCNETSSMSGTNRESTTRGFLFARCILREGWEGYCVEQATLPGVEARAEKQGRRFYTSADGSSAGSEGESGSRSIASSSGSVMRRDLRKVRSFRVKAPSGSFWADSVASSASDSTWLRPMVASSMSMTSKPWSRMFLTTPAMFSDSETDSWIASPNFWIRFFTF